MTRSQILYTAPEVQEAVRKVGREVLAWMDREGLDSLRVLSVLEGARPFTRDLVAFLGREDPRKRVVVREVRVRGTSGTELLKRRELDLMGFDPGAGEGEPVLIVDDLADSGKTLLDLKKVLEEKGIRGVRTAVLVRKWRGDGVPLDFCGLDLGLDRESLARQGLKDRWLYGYGMDLDGNQRDLAHIGCLDIEA